MLILGIESSCDDTSVALVKKTADSPFVVLAEKTASQIDWHARYGGVIPELAGRLHAEAITPLIEDVLCNQPRPDAIAVTSGPGLISGLIVGVEAAKALSYAWNIPLIAVNHIDGHANAAIISQQPTANSQQNQKTQHIHKSGLSGYPDIILPAVCLIVSGGHTELLLNTMPNKYELIGKTRDDAAGECFDKVAKMIGLEYPGGPKISALAKEGNPNAINFPRPMINDDSYNFSFAGLKTAVLYYLRDNPQFVIPDLCASFEQAIVDVLVAKTLRAVQEYKPQTVILSGGVCANQNLRQSLASKLAELNPAINFLVPEIKYAMDNAAMIAVAGYFKALKDDFTLWREINANPNWECYG